MFDNVEITVNIPLAGYLYLQNLNIVLVHMDGSVVELGGDFFGYLFEETFPSKEDYNVDNAGGEDLFQLYSRLEDPYIKSLIENQYPQFIEAYQYDA